MFENLLECRANESSGVCVCVCVGGGGSWGVKEVFIYLFSLSPISFLGPMQWSSTCAKLLLFFSALPFIHYNVNTMGLLYNGKPAV